MNFIVSTKPIKDNLYLYLYLYELSLNTDH